MCSTKKNPSSRAVTTEDSKPYPVYIQIFQIPLQDNSDMFLQLKVISNI